jgi:Cys-tRNA(Pro) deacylase
LSKDDYPITPAIRVLREHNASFVPHLYTYEEHGGTRASALALNVDEHEVIKTLFLETDQKKPLLVLMHGDREVSTKELARILGVKRIEPGDAASGQRHTGYLFGGTSPFGTRTKMPVYAEESIFVLPRIYINGGKRGFLIEIDPSLLRTILKCVDVHAAILPT